METRKGNYLTLNRLRRIEVMDGCFESLTKIGQIDDLGYVLQNQSSWQVWKLQLEAFKIMAFATSDIN